MENARKLAVIATFRATRRKKLMIRLIVNRIDLATNMKRRETEGCQPLNRDRQLQGITLEYVIEKRSLDQALNAKEFAVCAGVSYSTARHWFHLPGFPVFHGVIFWQDFVHWRAGQYGLESPLVPHHNSDNATSTSNLPPRAAHILLDA